ncbi:MAG: SIR2 family protein [Fusobacterium sp.]|uniref:SIR2 family protein n=1 Tax=Fusobacterium sp. TaxID=68766 RepID=UPI002A75E7A9|nr:SIR2 family protein [Fusobacterium sp.]MDY3059233.1 SIR2 family protein [Fusobacterium sp.]
MIKKVISEVIKEANRQPFLFIGSGFSKRYLDLENWEELLRKFALEFSEDDFKYDSYANEIIEKDYYGKQPKIASLLEKDYNRAVLNDLKFKEFRNKYSTEIRSGISAFKIAIAKHLKNIDFKILKNNNNTEIVELKKMSIRNIAGIITTNYDLFLENIFPDYQVYVGQEELIFSDIFEVGEIYKIHGSVIEPNSIIITSEDYQKFEKKSAYLIAKILTIFLEYPIIFIGYSIQDKNIQNILKSISTCLSQEKLDKLKKRFIFVEYNPTQEKIDDFSTKFENGNVLSMTRISTNNFLDIYQGINLNPAKYSPKVLRTLKKEIYSLVETENPKGKIVATGFDTIEKFNDDMELIASLGVACRHGHLIKANQIYEDLVFDNQYFNPKLMLEEYLPSLLKNNSGGLPMYKYIKEEPTLLFERVKEHFMAKKRIEDFLNAQLINSKKNYRNNLKEFTIDEIIKKEGEENAFKKIYFLEENEIDVTKLESYLKSQFKTLKFDSELKIDSELKRLVRIYDFLKYKN